MKAAKKGIKCREFRVNFSEKDFTRFFDKVNQDGPVPDQALPTYRGLKACHIWTSAVVSKKNYGVFQQNGKTYLAHRIAWALANGGLLPGGFLVMHRCDNSSCVNPDHLFLGTPMDNMQDKILKKRGRAGAPRRGETNPNAKLTDDRVREIRLLAGKFTQRDVAKKFGVSQRLIWMVIQGEIWKHVT